MNWKKFKDVLPPENKCILVITDSDINLLQKK